MITMGKYDLYPKYFKRLHIHIFPPRLSYLFNFTRLRIEQIMTVYSQLHCWDLFGGCLALASWTSFVLHDEYQAKEPKNTSHTPYNKCSDTNVVIHGGF